MPVKQKTKSDTVAFNIRCISRDERQAFKVWCAEQGIAMEEAAVRILVAAAAGMLDKEGIKALIEPLTLTQN